MKKRQTKNDIHPMIFEEKEVRRVWHNEQWYFAVVDVAVGANSNRSRNDVSNIFRERQVCSLFKLPNIHILVVCVDSGLTQEVGRC